MSWNNSRAKLAPAVTHQIKSYVKCVFQGLVECNQRVSWSLIITLNTQNTREDSTHREGIWSPQSWLISQEGNVGSM